VKVNERPLEETPTRRRADPPIRGWVNLPLSEKDFHDLPQTGTISASDYPLKRPIRQYFAKIRHITFKIRSFWLLKGLKMAFPFPEITSYGVITAKNNPENGLHVPYGKPQKITCEKPHTDSTGWTIRG
jgi:hypothetical protein